MILEYVVLPVGAGRSAEFEVAFAEARPLIEASAGFLGLSLTRGVEHPDTYLLLVEWTSLGAHETGFRCGPRPVTSTDGPHRQLSQRATPALWGRLVASSFALPGVVEGHSAVSPASSRAVLLASRPELLAPGTSLAPPGNAVEPVHLHGMDDTSIHLCIPPERAAELCDRGWAEPHQYADHGSEIMVYGPRDEFEWEFVVGLISESVGWATERNAEESHH